LRGEKDNDKKKLIKIGHGTTGEADSNKTTASLTEVREDVIPRDDGNNLQFTQLKNGSYLKVPTCKYDRAGHFINNIGNTENPVYTYYKLPSAQLVITTPTTDDEEEEGGITPNESDVL
jgi:hypothetical protein